MTEIRKLLSMPFNKIDQVVFCQGQRVAEILVVNVDDVVCKKIDMPLVKIQRVGNTSAAKGSFEFSLDKRYVKALRFTDNCQRPLTSATKLNSIFAEDLSRSIVGTNNICNRQIMIYRSRTL